MAVPMPVSYTHLILVVQAGLLVVQHQPAQAGVIVLQNCDIAVFLQTVDVYKRQPQTEQTNFFIFPFPPVTFEFSTHSH